MAKSYSEITEDAFLGGRLRLRQPKSGHRAGHDAMLLAAATFARPGDRVIELGAGVGAAGLAVAHRIAALDMVLVEIDPTLADLASANAASNGIDARIIALDVTSDAQAFAAAGLSPDSADAVLMNPPFNDSARHQPSPDAARQAAHVAAPSMLDAWVHAARRILKSGGVLTMIWRADAIGEALAALDRGFGSVAILPVHSEPTAPAIRILLRATKGGRAPTRVYAGLMLNDSAGVPNKQTHQILSGEGSLPLAVP